MYRGRVTVSSRVVALFLLLLAGCYDSHAPWERAAPDGSAISMRLEITAWPAAAPGILEVRFDGTYLAAPINGLEVCTGTLTSAELDGWIGLIQRTGAFEREGLQGRAWLHAGGVRVSLASEGGLATSFSFTGFGDALEGFATRAKDFWASLDLDACAPEALDPQRSSLRAQIQLFEPGWGWEGARLEVTTTGAVNGYFGPNYWTDVEQLEPCAPLIEPDRFWATVLAGAPYDVPYDRRWPEYGRRQVSTVIETEVTAGDGTTHRRWVPAQLRPSRPEHTRLIDALITLFETRCR